MSAGLRSRLINSTNTYPNPLTKKKKEDKFTAFTPWQQACRWMTDHFLQQVPPTDCFFMIGDMTVDSAAWTAAKPNCKEFQAVRGHVGREKGWRKTARREILWHNIVRHSSVCRGSHAASWRLVNTPLTGEGAAINSPCCAHRAARTHTDTLMHKCMLRHMRAITRKQTQVRHTR